jgi:hypothetical protein
MLGIVAMLFHQRHKGVLSPVAESYIRLFKLRFVLGDITSTASLYERSSLPPVEEPVT